MSTVINSEWLEYELFSSLGFFSILKNSKRKRKKEGENAARKWEGKWEEGKQGQQTGNYCSKYLM